MGHPPSWIGPSSPDCGTLPEARSPSPLAWQTRPDGRLRRSLAASAVDAIDILSRQRRVGPLLDIGHGRNSGTKPTHPHEPPLEALPSQFQPEPQPETARSARRPRAPKAAPRGWPATDGHSDAGRIMISRIKFPGFVHGRHPINWNFSARDKVLPQTRWASTSGCIGFGLGGTEPVLNGSLLNRPRWQGRRHVVPTARYPCTVNRRLLTLHGVVFAILNGAARPSAMRPCR